MCADAAFAESVHDLLHTFLQIRTEPDPSNPAIVIQITETGFQSKIQLWQEEKSGTPYRPIAALPGSAGSRWTQPS